MSYQILSSAGLFLDIIGAWLVFKNALISDQYAGDSIMAEESKTAEKERLAKNSRIKFKANLGFVLLFIGFILQFIGSIIPLLPS